MGAGWNNEIERGSIPFIPVDGSTGGNIVSKSTSNSMSWWKGTRQRVSTLVDCLTLRDVVSQVPERSNNGPLRIPILQVWKFLKSSGTILIGRVEQGTLTRYDRNSNKDKRLICIYGGSREREISKTYHKKLPAAGIENGLALHPSILGIEVNGVPVDRVKAGDFAAIRVKDDSAIYRCGDVIGYWDDKTLLAVGPDNCKFKRFVAEVQRTNSGPKFIKVGYEAYCFIGFGHGNCRVVGIRWKECLKTGKREYSPSYLQQGEKGEVVFEPARWNIVCHSLNNSDQLSRVFCLDAYRREAMCGKILAVEKTSSGEASSSTSWKNLLRSVEPVRFAMLVCVFVLLGLIYMVFWADASLFLDTVKGVYYRLRFGRMAQRKSSQYKLLNQPAANKRDSSSV